MAAVDLVGSRIMTPLAATPSVMADPGEGGGIVRTWIETVETNADDSVSSTYLLARLPSNARILANSKIFWDDLGTGTGEIDVGVFNQSGNSEITDDPDALTNGIDPTTAGSATLIAAIADIGIALWDHTAAASDPKVDLDIKATLTTGPITAIGTITVEILYTLD